MTDWLVHDKSPGFFKGRRYSCRIFATCSGNVRLSAPTTLNLLCNFTNDIAGMEFALLHQVFRKHHGQGSLAFGGCGHAFTNPAAQDPKGGMQYNPLADERGFHMMRDHLAEVFGDAWKTTVTACPWPA